MPRNPDTPRGPQGPGVRGGSREARRLAAALLEVLAGVRTPAQAAQALGISLSRYYALEVRALEGFVAACEPRTPGRQPSPERAVKELEAEVAKLQRDNARLQALVRSAGRAVGLSAPKPPPKAKGANGTPKRRRKKPVARALRAAKRLQSDAPPPGVTEPGKESA